jgi:predicted nucleic acid-binding protein
MPTLPKPSSAVCCCLLRSVPEDSATERQILRLTATFGVTFYDAAYHALAIVREGVFVTADEKYLNAVAGEPHAMHLKDWR